MTNEVYLSSQTSSKPLTDNLYQGDQLEFRKICAIAPRIARDQVIPGDGRVRAYEEIGQRGSLPAAASPVGEK
jgi:hypothetical protein